MARPIPTPVFHFTHVDHLHDVAVVVAAWTEAEVAVWGTVPERVSIAAGPDAWLSVDGLDAYRGVWRRALRAARES